MLAALLLIVPLNATPRDRCDAVEVNHVYDGDGEPVFTQLIFWDFDSRESRYHVRAWRLVKCRSCLPERDWQRGGWVCAWQDGDTFREVRAASRQETWTQWDRELLERETMPKQWRRELQVIRSDWNKP